ncbi:hypothetical protein [Sediminibacterium ginsengisoli]|uniref:Uncharacterized protein n=1 Tax=Sediminibacterium ginsengisoli TaxID=413434 RepID=A0A1T4Q264_9BACT|nr:hypothetical protein [Sediminibacterium ginsengisoli]SJZ97774.1 hypothetical protein SAMN04488132_10799 [Sediminibacterium ginsengisoli]
MITNLPEAVQQRLALPALEKVDPNRQDVSVETGQVVDSHAQAAVTAMLTGIFKLTRTAEGAALLINEPAQGDKVSVVFGDKADEVVQKVAATGTAGAERTRDLMNRIWDAVTAIIRENTEQPVTPESVVTMMSNERHNILVYLPATLQMGELLEDTTLDDRTNKMEGPVSGLMHKIENIFSGKE